jgi:uncharacterized protein YodC (DUF2158 family)
MGDENKFRVGQVVKLRSGGPDMTVEGIELGSVAVVWFDSARCEPCRASFPPDSLVEA